MNVSESKRRSALWFYAISAGVLILDQLAKAAARFLLAHDVPRTVIPGFFDLRLTYNTGAAFGVLPDWTPLFIIVALAAVYAIVRLRRSHGSAGTLAAGLGMLMGGALGNLVDRLAFPKLGVTDFISLHIGSFAWPAFNVADIGIVAGAALTILHIYVLDKRASSDRQPVGRG